MPMGWGVLDVGTGNPQKNRLERKIFGFSNLPTEFIFENPDRKNAKNVVKESKGARSA